MPRPILSQLARQRGPAVQQTKNAAQQAQEAQRQQAEEQATSIFNLPPAEQYGRLAENIGGAAQDIGSAIANYGNPAADPNSPQSLGQFAGNVFEDLKGAADFVVYSPRNAARAVGDAFGGGQDESIPTEGETFGPEYNPEDIASKQMMDGFAIRTNAKASTFQLFQELYAEPGLSPRSRELLDVAYEQNLTEVQQLDAEINERLATLQAGNELLGYDPETQTVSGADVNKAGLVPGVSGQRGGEAGGGGSTRAVGGAFERATARAVDLMPNVQGQSGPFTFVKGGAESASHRQMQEDQMRDLIGQTDSLVESGASGGGGEGFTQKADSLAQKAASLQMDALGIQDELTRTKMQLAFEDSIRTDIDDLVQQRQDIVSGFEGARSAIEREEVAQAAQTFSLAFDPTPEGAYLDAFQTRMDEFLTQSGFEETQPGQFDTIMELSTGISQLPDNVIDVLVNGIPEGTETDPLTGAPVGIDPSVKESVDNAELAIEQAANQFDLDPTALKNEIVRARAGASKIFQEIQNVGASGRIEPGSHAAAYAIFQEAAPRLGEEAAQQLANSPALHELINITSGGRIGKEKGGSLAGIGGLTKDTYRSLNAEPGDLSSEMGALIDYLIVQYGGDPVAALMDYTDTKQWGRLQG